jgi:hypothetical protein
MATNYKAGWRKWVAAGFTSELLPIIPEGAPLAPSSKIDPAILGKVPGKRTLQGTWVGLGGKWSDNLITTPKDVERYERMGAHIGMQGRKLHGFDLDIEDKRIVRDIAEIIVKHCGQTCIRWRENSHRILLVYRATPGEVSYKWRLAFRADGVDHAIDFLGKGQYYNVDGMHPSGHPYQWGDPHPCYQGWDKIPTVSRAQIDDARNELLQYIEMFYELTGRSNSGGNRDAVKLDSPSLHAPKPEYVLELLETVPCNETVFETRDEYVLVLRAIKASLGSAAAEHWPTVLTWSLNYPGAEDHYIENIWNSVTDSTVGWSFLAAWGRRHGYDGETQRVFDEPDDPASFFELAADAIRARRADLALLKVDWPDAYDTVRTELERRSTITGTELDALVSEDARKLSNGDGSTAPASSIIKANPFEWQDPTTIPRRAWLYDRHFIRGFVGTTIAPGGVGKSALLTVEILAMVTGKNLLGELPVSPLRVWYINLEDPPDELQRRFAAACSHHGISPEDIGGRLFVNSGRETAIEIAQDDRSGLKIAQPVIDALRGEMQSKKIDVLVIDPFVASHGVSENDNNKINAVLRVWIMLADETGCSIELVHHTRKAAHGQGEYSVDDARGASAMIGAVRSARTLNVMTKEEATQAGLAQRQRRSFFRVDNGKANLAPPPETTTWRRLISVQLGNGESSAVPGDSVGVVDTWEYPNPSDDVTPEQVRAVREAVEAGEWRESSQATDWVGRPIADALELDLADPSVKAKVKGLQRLWLNEGVLKVVVRKDAKRQNKAFVQVGDKKVAAKAAA